MEFFIQQLINGLTLGSIYALIALGYTMVYGIIQLINFAHGEIFAAGGYMGVVLLSFLAARGLLETHPWLCLGGAMLLAMIYCAFLAMAVEKVAYKRLRFSSRLSALVSALGMSIFLQNGLMLTQGVYDKAYPASFAQGGFTFGNITLSYLQIIIFVVTAAVLGGIGNITGALLGGLIIGMVEIFGAGYISGQYKDVFAFIILISVLYFMPTGIMGENVDDTRV